MAHATADATMRQLRDEIERLSEAAPVDEAAHPAGGVTGAARGWHAPLGRWAEALPWRGERGAQAVGAAMSRCVDQILPFSGRFSGVLVV
jgi:hypothetical protein